MRKQFISPFRKYVHDDVGLFLYILFYNILSKKKKHKYLNR